MSFVLTKDLLDKVEKAVDTKNSQFVENELSLLRPADISTVLNEMDTEQAMFVMDLLTVETAAEIISYLDEDVCIPFIRNYPSETIAQWINYIDSDDAADILNELPLQTREEIIAFLDSKEKADYIIDLLHYEEDCAGGLMAKELISANINWTVIQAIDEIRRQAEKVEKIYSLYVVDNQERLLGRVSLKKIILSNDETRIADIYEQGIVAVKTYQDEDEVAEIMRKYDLAAVPVINERGKLMGRITIDDAVDVITEQAEEERQIITGISEDIEEDDNVLMLTRARLPWLIIGMAGGLMGARFIGLFEKDLAILPAMAFFIPLITATGGNVGIQSSSIVLQSLANKSMIGVNYFQRLFKVLIVAIINGVVISVIVFGFTIILGQTVNLAGIVAISLFFVVLLASFMGTITPLVLDKLGINPALAAGPFITTANDLLGLAVYFSTAHMLYSF
ncbi:magnesium transporter [Microscilla marina]|uniref:Magnesium transporter MgtE n=1 Tax=Microscilla marina ATCC 23134 TaxID=313606 RepID=A2A024_MICM2|nr:magnesium transporter [Microscilla marina]EAY24019.1 magnesium transporter [Microscilla marina ATCC 23134]